MARAVANAAQGGAVLLSHSAWAQLPGSSWSTEQQCWYLGYFIVEDELPPADMYKVCAPGLTDCVCMPSCIVLPGRCWCPPSPPPPSFPNSTVFPFLTSSLRRLGFHQCFFPKRILHN